MSRGGYRIGAGRPGWHAKTAGKAKLDVRMLHRFGYLAREYRLTQDWSNGLSADLQTSRDAVVVTIRGQGGQDVRRTIPIERTACNFGGDRPWWLCPRCCERAAILYVPALACRRCLQLVYPVQSQCETQRSWRRTRKIEKRLVGNGDCDFTRPKGMRWATYWRLVDAHRREQQFRDAQLVALTKREFGSDWLT